MSTPPELSDLVAPPVRCEPCRRSNRDNGPVEMLWHDPRGYVWPLCASCCSLWLLYSCEDEDMAPAGVELFTAVSR